jgi:hypothetical protein
LRQTANFISYSLHSATKTRIGQEAAEISGKGVDKSVSKQKATQFRRVMRFLSLLMVIKPASNAPNQAPHNPDLIEPSGRFVSSRDWVADGEQQRSEGRASRFNPLCKDLLCARGQPHYLLLGFYFGS